MRSIKGLVVCFVIALAPFAFSQSVLATPQFTSPSVGSDFNPMDPDTLPKGYQIWSNSAKITDQANGFRFYEEQATSTSKPAAMPELSMTTPDPSTIALVGLGLICLGMVRRKRHKKREQDRAAG